MGRFRWHRVAVVKRGVRPPKTKPLQYDEEYTKTPQYPPILDQSYLARSKRWKSKWYEEVKSIKTVEEKLFKINMPRYYGWCPLILKEGSIPINCLPLAQHVTRTHLLEFKDLPHNVGDVSDKLLEQIKPKVEEALVFEYKYRSRKHQHANTEDGPLPVTELDNIIGKSVVQQFNRIILSTLLESAPHLLKCQVEPDPRVECFWLAGWENPTELFKKRLEKTKPWKLDLLKEPVNRWIQYFGSPILHLRHELPLPAIVDLHESEDARYDVPSYHYHPSVLGLTSDRRAGTTIPGFWPGDPCEFGLLSFHQRGHILERKEDYGPDDKVETLNVQAILASYSWLHAQACYQGFSTYNDLTYPLVTQTVITNGKLWSFYMYQLNTMLLHTEHILCNPRHNLCWGTNELKLFEEITDDKVIGFNDEVLKTLLMFYLHTPRLREGVEMKPYLGEDEKVIADITDVKRRAWLEGRFKYMYSGRQRHKLPPEIYDWEKIYKIYFKTRSMEARRRPFELRKNPLFERKYDGHTPHYIPRKFRDPERYRKKYEDTYYP